MYGNERGNYIENIKIYLKNIEKKVNEIITTERGLFKIDQISLILLGTL